MVWVYWVAGGIVALILLCVWFAGSANRRTRQEVRKVTIDDIDSLVEECIVTVRKKLGLELDLNNLQGSASILDENISRPELRNAFIQKGSAWRFVLPVGAFLGELIRYHRDAGWQEEEDGSLSIWIKDGQEEKTIKPFELVLQQGFAKKGTVFASLFTHVFPFEEGAESESTGADVRIDSYDTEGMPAGFVHEAPANVGTSNLEKQVENGANWFFWIAGLSLVNSVLFLTNIEWGFFFGLGITQIIDVIATEILSDGNHLARIVAFAFDVIAASIFVLFGFLARKQRRWAFVVGMILYGLDGMLFMLAKDFLGLGVHFVALLGIFNGCKASWTLKAKAEYESSVPGTSLKPMPVSFNEETNPDAHAAKTVWPVVITIISLIYAILYTLVNIRSLSSWWRLVTCAFLFCGVLGIALKRKRGVALLLIGSALVLLHLAYRISLLVSGMSETPAASEIVGMSIVALLFAAWPSFLIIWFVRKRIRDVVRDEWR